MAPSSADEVTFDGHNWEDLLRLDTACKLARLYSPGDFLNSDEHYQPSFQIGWLASRFRGAALDWVGKEMTTRPTLFADDYDAFVEATREAFGISEVQLAAHRRTQLDKLSWQADLPVFFAEFDRLALQLNVTTDATKIALLRTKLPVKVKTLIAEQALDFQNYDTMRERLLTMWALDPGAHVVAVKAPHPEVTKGKARKKVAKSGPKN